MAELAPETYKQLHAELQRCKQGLLSFEGLLNAYQSILQGARKERESENLKGNGQGPCLLPIPV